ncbi:PREDICTED: peroxisomal membrane protein 11C-like [Amphimedon queenslandica]|uniref:Uncharacterized protein n=1 Tax=Amphimedon queenslandica TaxID=400682 RepID=A0A1X7V647_AMPQE|nr:PREDICTED: peroxisomal membrane protein 11C-like [Amphimedon queenslandica]|eukprot:XP_011403032.1 PREDICTED: peroxisomal membrane protein 11C-like [Amphimedon queenslandica]
MALEYLEDTFTKYPCRDKLLRVCQYAAIFYDGALVEPRNGRLLMVRRFITKDKSESTAARVSSSISAARLVFRLLNTPATLCNVKNIYQKWNENDSNHELFAFALDALECLASLAYNPVEQLSWAGQVSKLFDSPRREWLSIWCTKLWIMLLIINIMRSWRLLRTVYKSGEWKMPVLSLVQDIADLINAIHFLPAGFLWSSRLPTILVGLLGMISSSIALYKVL